MSKFIGFAALAVLLFAAGCAGPGTYPITRTKAGPNDAVLEMAPVPNFGF